MTSNACVAMVTGLNRECPLIRVKYFPNLYLNYFVFLTTMEEVVNSDVQVVLSVKEGKGFEQVSQSTLIIASLNGHSLETDAIDPNPNPQYTTDLVWEIDKGRLRKMRSGQVPLKLECFAVRGYDNKEKLGYLLLSLRSAQIVASNSSIDVKSNWHRLLGLKNEIKAQKPELLLALSIREQDSVLSNASESSKITPILLNNERLIQLGPLSNCQDLFLMSITAISAANIESLLPEELTIDLKNNLNICCKIFENDIFFKPLMKESGEIWTLNEKIVIRIRSSLKVLKEYLRLKPDLFIYLRCKDNVIAKSELNLQSLVPNDNVQEFLQNSINGSTNLNQRCYLHKKDMIENADTSLRKSYLDVQLKLQYVGTQTDSSTGVFNTQLTSSKDIPFAENPIKVQTSNVSQVNHNEIDSHRNPGGDVGKCLNTINYALNYPNEICNTNKHSLSCEVLKNQPIKAIYSQSADAVLCQCNSSDCSKSVEAYHCYRLNVSLMAITLTSPILTVRNIEVRFHHPKTEITSTFCPNTRLLLGEKVQLENVECKFQFISASDEIKHLLLCFPPKISIHDAEDRKMCISQFMLDVKQLFIQRTSECKSDIPLYDMEQNKIGNLEIKYNLEDHGPYYRVKRRATSENLGPPILDDSLAYKIVDELETWKERQKEIFKVELKRKEERHLNLLSEEWEKQRENLESKLACSVEQCKMLANSLNNATEDLRTRRLKSLEKEARLIKANEDLQWRYDVKVQELKESFRQMQEELTSKINVLENRKTMLESQVEPLTLENERLRLLVSKQSEELETLQKASLTQDQTTTILQELKTLEEKLHNAQESKSFFKEQWAKAVREIHRMKLEYQQAIQVQIKNSKEELQNIDLEDILCADSNALTNDKAILSQIQKEIDVIKPKPSFFETESYNQIFTPTTSMKIPQATNNVMPKRSDEYDERLKALIEERDSLLKTGSYTIDDAVIVKLNAEIRSLMIR